MARLTAHDRRLLSYPPTEKTWICPKKYERNGEQVVCGCFNSGSATQCAFCRANKPARPKLVWPLYLSACQKAKHTPGERWPVKADGAEKPVNKPKTTRKRG